MSRNCITPLFVGSLALAVMLLAASPGFTSPPSVGAEKGSRHHVVARGPAAGNSLETALAQALDEGADPCQLLKKALSQDADLARLFTFFLGRLAADPDFAGRCSPCLLLRCAVEAGKDAVEAANAMMSAGGKLAEVRSCLASMGFDGSETYTYTPPDPPAVTPGVIPTFLGNGGGGPISDEDPSPSS